MLTNVQEMKIQRVASCGLCKFLRGTATTMDYAGTGIALGTTLVAGGLHMVANGIDGAGEKADSMLKAGAESLRERAQDFDLSDISDEDLLQAIEAEQVQPAASDPVHQAVVA